MFLILRDARLAKRERDVRSTDAGGAAGRAPRVWACKPAASSGARPAQRRPARNDRLPFGISVGIVDSECRLLEDEGTTDRARTRRVRGDTRLFRTLIHRHHIGDYGNSRLKIRVKNEKKKKDHFLPLGTVAQTCCFAISGEQSGQPPEVRSLSHLLALDCVSFGETRWEGRVCRRERTRRIFSLSLSRGARRRRDAERPRNARIAC